MVVDWWIKATVLLGSVASSAECVGVKLLGSFYSQFCRAGFDTSDGVKSFRESFLNWSLQDNNGFIFRFEFLDFLYLSEPLIFKETIFLINFDVLKIVFHKLLAKVDVTL